MSATETEPRWVLTLYISGASAYSAGALETLRRICDEELTGRVDLNVIDVHDQPHLVVADRIIAVPTMVKRLPPPLRRLVGDLADIERVRLGLDLGPVVRTLDERGRSTEPR